MRHSRHLPNRPFTLEPLFLSTLSLFVRDILIVHWPRLKTGSSIDSLKHIFRVPSSDQALILPFSYMIGDLYMSACTVPSIEKALTKCLLDRKVDRWWIAGWKGRWMDGCVEGLNGRICLLCLFNILYTFLEVRWGWTWPLLLSNMALCPRPN